MEKGIKNNYSINETMDVANSVSGVDLNFYKSLFSGFVFT